MKIPKIENKPNKSGIKYPHVSTWDVIKEYINLMRPHRFAFIITLFGIIVAIVAGSIVAPIYYKKFFDALTLAASSPTRDISSIVPIIFSILILNGIAWIGWRVSSFLIGYTEGHTMGRAFQKSFDYMIEHSYSFFSNNFVGSLTQRVNRFTRCFEALYDNIVLDLFGLFLRVFGACIVLYFSKPFLAYVMAIWIFVFITVSYLLTRIKLKYDIEASAMNSKLSGMLSDTISNHNAVQAFSNFSDESERISKVNIPLTKLNMFRWNFANALDAAQAIVTIIAEFCIFYFGIKFWQAGSISLGTFVLIQSYMIGIGGSLWGFSRIVRNIYQNLADAKEMVEILRLKHEIIDNPNAHPLKVDKGAIDYKDVSFAFGEGKTVFEGMNISIKPGEKVAFIGSSGAGKSTLVKLLLRLYDIQKGAIFVDGQNIKNVTQETLRNNISLVPQDPALFHRTLMDNIRYGKRDATDEEVMRAAKLAHCHEFIEGFPQKYETYVGERGVKLSGGERQRVAIARAILKNAPILVLDEATSSLDSHSESLIQDALHTLMKDKTVIVIAHRLSTIRQMDRIIVISKGGVVEEGTHEELIGKTGGVYAKLWSLQAHGFANKSIEELLDEETSGEKTESI